MYGGKSPDDGQRNCPKPVEFYSKNEFEKLVHLVGFITRTTALLCIIYTPTCFDILHHHQSVTNTVRPKSFGTDFY